MTDAPPKLGMWIGWAILHGLVFGVFCIWLVWAVLWFGIAYVIARIFYSRALLHAVKLLDPETAHNLSVRGIATYGAVLNGISTISGGPHVGNNANQLAQRHSVNRHYGKMAA